MSDAAPEVALVCLGDDPALGSRLRETAWRGIVPTVFARSDDVDARRLAVAAGARIGSIFPDVSADVVLVESGTASTVTGLDGRVVVAAPGVSCPGATRVVRIVSGSPPDPPPEPLAIENWDGRMLDDLAEGGWRVTAAAPATPPSRERLDGIRALHVTSVHRPDDGRIFHKEVMALRAAGADASVLGFDPRPGRARRVPAGWRLMAEARRRRPDIVHIHDPELLPAAWALRSSSSAAVIYDAHEYVGQTTRTKPWIPGPLRVPAATVVERLERTLAGRVDAVVAVTEDMALGFAEGGIRSVSVANFAPRDRFPEPGPPAGPVVVYVGALDPSRGLELMKEAFPLVDVPGVRLLLAGPGDPGTLPPGVEHIGRVGYADVPAILARAAVIWIPLRRTPNNDRGRLTKVAEAMACGRPLVASDLARTAAIVRQSGCGLVVPFDDPAAHAAAIEELLSDPARAARMGAAGRDAFLSGMTFEGEATKLVALYAEIARERGVAR